MVHHPNSMYSAIQKLWKITSSLKINDQMGNECLKNGFYLMVIDLIALLSKVLIGHGMDHHDVLATIAIYVFMHFVNVQLVHVFHKFR